jgi:chitinase
MTYDMHGAWESTTNFHSPLYASSTDPTRALNYNTDYAVRAYLGAGVPSGKITVGVPFYGRGWQGVPNVNNGLYQTGSGGAPGTYEVGIDDYKVLKNLEATYTKFRHAEAQAMWIYNPSTGIFWSYDDPTSMTTKMNYIKSLNLGGAMFWELSGDTTTGELITALANGLR